MQTSTESCQVADQESILVKHEPRKEKMFFTLRRGWVCLKALATDATLGAAPLAQSFSAWSQAHDRIARRARWVAASKEARKARWGAAGSGAPPGVGHGASPGLRPS